MLPVALFLEKFREAPAGYRLKQELIRVIFEITKIKLNTDQVIIRGPTVYLKIPPIQKSAIFLKKQAITQSLKERAGNSNLRSSLRFG